jgi:hypothetical protein
MNDDDNRMDGRSYAQRRLFVLPSLSLPLLPLTKSDSLVPPDWVVSPDITTHLTHIKTRFLTGLEFLNSTVTPESEFRVTPGEPDRSRVRYPLPLSDDPYVLLPPLSLLSFFPVPVSPSLTLSRALSLPPSSTISIYESWIINFTVGMAMIDFI